MNRLRQPQAEAMGRALRLIPSRLHDAVGCDVFCADPIFAGLYRPPFDHEATDDGRSYRATAHCAYPYHTRDGRSTVALPEEEGVVTAVHELGHVLHWALKERAGGWGKVPRFEIASDYARTNRREEFAEAFTVWCCWPPEFLEHFPRYSWSRSNDEWFDRLLNC